MQQEINRLEKIEQQIRADLKAKDDMEEYVVLESRNIAEQLEKPRLLQSEIDGVAYRFMYRTVPMGQSYGIELYAYNVSKATIMGNKYSPYSVKTEATTQGTLLDNLSSATEALLRYILNVIKPEILPDED